MNILKRLFCNHEYQNLKANIPIHNPNSEPLKYLQIEKCEKCGKELEFITDEKFDYALHVNEQIEVYEKSGGLNTDDISDGCHTFGELYKHRCYLFAVICNSNKDKAWKSKKHSDGSMYDGMFIVGINTSNGEATYHYDMKYWELFKVKEIANSPEYDGYTPDDVINRLLTINER